MHVGAVSMCRSCFQRIQADWILLAMSSSVQSRRSRSLPSTRMPLPVMSSPGRTFLACAGLVVRKAVFSWLSSNPISFKTVVTSLSMRAALAGVALINIKSSTNSKWDRRVAVPMLHPSSRVDQSGFSVWICLSMVAANKIPLSGAPCFVPLSRRMLSAGLHPKSSGDIWAPMVSRVSAKTICL